MLNGTHDLKVTTDKNTTTPHLFVGLSQDGDFHIPAGLLMEEVVLDLTFAPDGSYGKNERCVFMPGLSSKTKDSLISVSVIDLGQGGTEEKDVILYDTVDLNADRSVKSNPKYGGRLLVDINANGETENIRILDGGRGYEEDVPIDFNTAVGKKELTTALSVEASCKLDKDTKFVNDPMWSSDIVFVVVTNGSGFEEGKQYTAVSTLDSDNSFTITCTSTKGDDDDEMVRCELSSEAENNRLRLAGQGECEYTIDSGVDGKDSASLYVISHLLPVTCDNLAGGKTFAVYDLVNDGNGSKAVVTAVQNDLPTQVGVYEKLQGFAVGDTIAKDADAGATCDITAVGTGELTYEAVGLGLDPIYDFDDYDSNGNVLETQKMTIDVKNCFLQMDVLYFMDGSWEREQKAMMSPTGLPFTYTQFLNTTSTITQASQAKDWGEAKPQEVNRLLGLSNSVVRTIMWSIQNSGKQDKDKLPYYQKNKWNPLLGKFHSRSSLCDNGSRFNLSINSVPYFSSQVETDLRAFRQLCDCQGNFYVNRPQFIASNQCRQLDDKQDAITDDNPSLQPAFCDLDDPTKATRQYQLNDRQAGIVNQSYNGVDQSWLRGMAHYFGVDFKMSKQNVMGNGVPIGATPVDLTLELYDTYDSNYSGTGRLSVFSEVERRLVFKNGDVLLQTASY